MADYIKFKKDNNEDNNNANSKSSKFTIEKPMKENNGNNNTNKRIIRRPRFSFKTMIFTFIVIFFVLSFIEGIVFNMSSKIEVIPIKGVIATEGGSSIVYGDMLSSREVAKEIYKAADDETIKMIVLDINSGGGSPVASEEISKAINYAKESKEVISIIGDIGASGAYWIAASTDKIYVSPMSIVGSIGVTSAGLGFEDFIANYNITYRRLVAGKYKDLGSPFKEMTEEEEEIMQNLLDSVYHKFVQHIADNRGMEYSAVEELATGAIFTGEKAIELGLVDEVAYYEELIKDLKKEHDTSIILTYEADMSFFEQLSKVFTSPSLNLFNNNLIMR